MSNLFILLMLDAIGSLAFASIIVFPYLLWSNRRTVGRVVRWLALLPWRGIQAYIRLLVRADLSGTLARLSVILLMGLMFWACGCRAETRPHATQGPTYPTTDGVHLAMDIGVTRDVLHWTRRKAIPRLHTYLSHRKGVR